MTLRSKHLRDLPWFTVGIAGVFFVSLLLRFWGLGRFNTLVFDEFYFAKFASHYLKQEPLFEGHPPLSTYLIAIGIWIANHTPIGADPIKNGFSGLYLSPISYRWLNALTGACIPPIVAGIAYHLSHRRSYALVAGIFAAADGLFLVESRYALINIYLVLFGLLGHWLFLLALNRSHKGIWLVLSGISFGAAGAVKWNGFGFLLGIYFVWSAAWIFRWLQRTRLGLARRSPPSAVALLTQSTRLHLGHLVLYLGIIPAVTYWLSWLPYMQMTPQTSFWEWQTRILEYHNRVGGMDAHPYCSPWYTWPLMLRPVAYFYQAAHGLNEPPPIVGPPLPSSATRAIYDVHAMGNPILWWLSTAAIGLLAVWLLLQVGQQFLRLITRSQPAQTPAQMEFGIVLYLVSNWATHWLPWARVDRCVFIYHYMGSATFALLAIAWMCDRWLNSPSRWRQVAGMTTLVLVLAAFLFWLPLYLGLPLTPEGLAARRWFQSWI